MTADGSIVWRSAGGVKPPARVKSQSVRIFMKSPAECSSQQPAVRTILKILIIPKYLQTHVCPAWNWWPALSSVPCSELDLQSVKLFSLNNIHPKIELPNCLDTEIIINAKYKSQTPHKWAYNHNQLLNVESSTAWKEQEPGLG